MKIRIQSLDFVMLTLVAFALAPITEAVVPPPDGGYPGFNTAEATKAHQNLTTGIANTAVGWYSLSSNGAASFNTAIGAGTLLASTGDQNTGTGVGALLSNTSGAQNTANGAFALFNNTDGVLNTATGANALFSNTTGDDNVAVGYQTLYHNTTGGINTAIGWQALFSNTEGSSNTATGVNVLFNSTTGSFNTASGDGALFSNTSGDENTATGYATLNNNNTGFNNTANGSHALQSNTEGHNDTAEGNSALQSNSTGLENTAVGYRALAQNATGSHNTALGAFAGGGVITAESVICIGVTGDDVSSSCYIGNIWNQPGGSQAVYVNSEGKLGAQVSSRRFKDEVKPIERNSEIIYRLRPVSFRYKREIEPTRPLGFGLIAEEVEKISSDLVTRDGSGQPNAVRYDAVNAMLLNEFLKEHRKVEELKSAMAQQQKDFEAAIYRQQQEIKALVTRLNDQETRIRKVSARIEMHQSDMQMLVRDP